MTESSRPNQSKSRFDRMWIPALPMIAILGALTLPIFVYLIFISFMEYNPLTAEASHFTGLNNYIEAFSSPLFLQSLKITPLLVVLCMIIEIPLGLTLALIADSLFGRAVKAIQTIIIMPIMFVPVATALVWRLMFSFDYGIINYLISLIGLEKISWFSNTYNALIVLAVMDIWQWVPFVFLIAFAALRVVPREPQEAAEIDGAGAWQRFRHILFPYIKPAFLLILLFRFTDLIRLFDIVFIGTKGAPGNTTATLSYFIYQTAFNRLLMGDAAAQSIILLIITLGVSMVLMRWLYREAI